jgi:hypothetical protein
VHRAIAKATIQHSDGAGASLCFATVAIALCSVAARRVS